jgi:hypothetical protein
VFVEQQEPSAKALSFFGGVQGLKPPANPVEQATARATARAKAKANAGVLRFAQDDGVKQATTNATTTANANANATTTTTTTTTTTNAITRAMQLQRQGQTLKPIRVLSLTGSG